MSSIARKFGVSLADLIAANPQIPDPDKIYPGQVINIPGNGGGPRPATQNSYSIVVNKAGNAARRSDPNISSRRANTGAYDVTFPQDVDDWMWQATRGAPNGSPQVAGSVTTQLGAMGANDTVRVKS
jgi:LysM repeat protein